MKAQDKQLIDSMLDPLSESQLGPPGGEDPQGRVQPGEKLKPSLTTKETRLFVIRMFAQGYTIRKISRELTARTGQKPEEHHLLKFYNDYAKDIDQYRQEVAQRVMSTGLARKESRIQRLTNIVEEWEERAAADPKAANVYLKTLEQLRRETQELNLNVLTPDDPWYLIVVQLNQLSDNPTPGVTSPQLTPPSEDIVDINSTSEDLPQSK